MNLLQPMMVAALLIGGLGVALLGSVKVPLARRLHIDEARVGGLVSMFGFAMMPIILTAGFLTDLVGRQAVLMTGSGLLALSLVGLGRAKNYGLALLSVLCFSAGWSLLINVGNVLTPLAFPGSTAFATNLANVFFGLGAFLTPVGLAWLLGRTNFSAALTMIGVLTLIPALLALGTNFTVPTPPDLDPGQTAPSFADVLADPMLWLLGLGLFCYGPLEASVGAWATTFLGERGVAEKDTATLLSCFWLAFMLARLTAAFTMKPGMERGLVLALALVATLLMLGVVLCRSRGLAIFLVMAAGFVFGPIFPTLMALLLGHFPASMHGRAVGMFFAIGGIGWTLIPILIGAYARKTTLQRGFLIAVGAALGLSAVAAVLLARGN